MDLGWADLGWVDLSWADLTWADLGWPSPCWAEALLTLMLPTMTRREQGMRSPYTMSAM